MPDTVQNTCPHGAYILPIRCQEQGQGRWVWVEWKILILIWDMDDIQVEFFQSSTFSHILCYTSYIILHKNSN